MAKTTKNATLEGTISIEDPWGDSGLGEETGKIWDYRTEAITKPGSYVLADPLPHDFFVLSYVYRITEAISGTITLGDKTDQSKFIKDMDFNHIIGTWNKADPYPRLILKGDTIKLYLGTGSTGKIEFHMIGVLLKSSIL